MQKVTKEITLKLRATVTDFTSSFTNELSLPSELMVLLNLLRLEIVVMNLDFHCQ